MMSRIKTINIALNATLFILGLLLIALGLQQGALITACGAFILILSSLSVLTLSKWIFLINRQKEITRLQSEESEKLEPFFNVESNREEARLKKIIVDLAHDTRNPISTILGYADLLSIKQGIDADQAKSIEVIKRNSQTALDVIAKFVSLARNPEGQEQSQTTVTSKEEINLDQYFTQLQNEFAQSAKLLGVEFSVAKLTELPDQINTEGEKLRAIVNSMVSGALRQCITSKLPLKVSMGDMGPSGHKCILFVISYHSSKNEGRRFDALKQLIASLNGEFGHQRAAGSELEYFFKLPF